MLSRYVKELKTAIQCLGIKPKAIIYIIDSYIKDTECNGISVKLNQEGNGPRKFKKTTVINLANFDFPSCKGLAIKDC